MKRVSLLLSLLPLISNGQNIVRNPNFAEYLTCPPSQSQINLCKYWYNVTSLSPDYWHACNPNPNFSCPHNLAGHQQSPSHAMVGVFAYSGSNTREYFGCDIPPLTVGDIYAVTVSVSLADTMGQGCDGLGVLFYVNAKPDTLLDSIILTTPQIDYSSYGVIADKTNWTLLTSTFVADSAYTHIVLGNFKPDNLIHLVSTPPSWSVYTNASYYYFDSVSVERIGTSSVTNEANTSEILLYPSPTDQLLTITSGNKINDLVITNQIGQTLYCDHLDSRTAQIDVSFFAAGLYIVRVNGTYLKKFIKR